MVRETGGLVDTVKGGRGRGGGERGVPIRWSERQEALWARWDKGGGGGGEEVDQQGGR